MKPKMRRKLFLSVALGIVVLSLPCLTIGSYLVHKAVFDGAQERVSFDLKAAWARYNQELNDIKNVLRPMAGMRQVQAWVASRDQDSLQAVLEKVRMGYALDFLSLTDRTGRVLARGRYPFTRGDDRSMDPLVREALSGEVMASTHVVPGDILDLEGEGLRTAAFTTLEPTPRAKRRARRVERSGMVLEVAVPITEDKGEVVGVIFGGVLVNRRDGLVEKIKDAVFEKGPYQGKELATVTIFQWDARVATNVMKENGDRAIGARVSREVYDRVLERGQPFRDRDFVADDWYITAYDPIRNAYGTVVGILNVGVLEERHRDLRNKIVLAFVDIGLLGTILALGVCYLLARRVWPGFQFVLPNDWEGTPEERSSSAR